VTLSTAQAADINAETDGAIARHRADIVNGFVMAGVGTNRVDYPSRDCFAIVTGTTVEVVPRDMAPMMFAPLAADGGCVVECLAEPPPDGMVWIVVLLRDGITHVVRSVRELTGLDALESEEKGAPTK
jgi:hypothetical protein